MPDTSEFSILRASHLTVPNKDWTHYRSGLKVRCTANSSGVSLCVISQGKLIDTTHLTDSNVRFLTKEPIVGVKVFQGENLKKRLQLTFEASGHFNLFASKIKLWLGISVLEGRLMQKPGLNLNDSQTQTTASQKLIVDDEETIYSQRQPESQIQPTLEVSATPQERVQKAPQSSQPVITSSIPPTQVNNIPASQTLSTSQPTQINVENTYNSQPFGSASSYPSQSFPSFTAPNLSQNRGYQDSIASLLNAAQYSDLNNQAYSMQNSIYNPLQDSTIYSQASRVFDDSQSTNYSSFPQNDFTGQTTVQQPTVTAKDLQNALDDLPWQASQESERSTKRRKNKAKRSRMERYWDSVTEESLQQEQNATESLDDKQLSLKIARKLKSKSFISLVKRVDKIIHPQTELDEDSE